MLNKNVLRFLTLLKCPRVLIAAGIELNRFTIRDSDKGLILLILFYFLDFLGY